MRTPAAGPGSADAQGPAVTPPGRRPSPQRMRLALGLFVANTVMGWPAIAAAGGASPWIGLENAAMLGSASYILSWLLLGASIAIGGREVVVLGRGWIRRRLGRG